MRTALGVPKDETWILAFDAGGKEQLVEKGAPYHVDGGRDGVDFSMYAT